MKFIAPDDFSQGLRNPLKLPGGGTHISKGTEFSIGPDDIPFDRSGCGLSGEDLETFRLFFGAGKLVPLDSDQGRQIKAEIERAKTPRERHAEEFKTFDRSELFGKSEKDLAAWQSRHSIDEPQWRLAEFEWQRRITKEVVEATVFAARVQSWFGIAGVVIGVLLGAWIASRSK